MPSFGIRLKRKRNCGIRTMDLCASALNLAGVKLWKRSLESPIRYPRRKARVGEVAPTFLGVSLQHARYFKQLRRLQALSQQLRSGLGTLNSQLNREATWRAIRFAAGFPGGFGIWWGVQGLSPVWPVGLPLVCPSATDLGDV